MLLNILLVAIGGFFGSILRFLIADRMNRHVFSTWFANVSGSLVLALTLHYYLLDKISEPLFLLIGVGFSGAYTTFSTFGVETTNYILDRRYRAATLYTLGTFGVSIVLVAAVLLPR